MPEHPQVVLSYREVVEALVRKADIHEGIWGLFFKFGLAGANIGPTETQVSPAAVVTILEIGLQKFDKESNISFDAATLNPPRAAVAGEKQTTNV